MIYSFRKSVIEWIVIIIQQNVISFYRDFGT